MEHTKITSFFEISLTQNCLLVIDIDETIIMYDGICHKWWKNKMDYYLEKQYSFDEADNQCVKDWKEFIKDKHPMYTDKEGFFDLIDRAKKLSVETFIVTARDIQLEKITHDHLQHLNIVDIDVYFSSGGNKAHVINNVINNVMLQQLENYDQIIFIDDHDFNLNDVKEHFGDKAMCYKFAHKHNN